MKSELIVDVTSSEVQIALLEDSRLVSLQKEARNIAYAVGDIYLAKVKKLMPGLNAAFVNVGYEKDAFLHYLDLGPHFSTYSEFVRQTLDCPKTPPVLSKLKLRPEISKSGSIADVLEPGRPLLVQIVKEPISSKGPRLTTEISFTGRYMVLIPFCDKISISQKITSTEEKLRLRQLVASIKPKNFGVIVRTSAEGKRVAELNHELNTLVQCWNDMLDKARRAEAPALVFEEESRIVGMLRDVFSPSFESIVVNDAEVYRQIVKYVELIAPERAGIVSLYDKPVPVFDHFGITRQIKSSFGKTVSFRSGAYIIIEHTEALHVIDVNSGNRSRAAADQESNALEVNLRAADEIARQLRLRDMGGIIVVDFIDMAKAEHRQELYDHMREIMATDRARHNILPLSKFGLMQITRQRVRPVLDIHTEEVCPSCYGRGEVQPSLLFTDTLYEKLDTLINHMGMRDFIMYVHPYVEGYLKRGWLMSIFAKWRRKLGGNFKIIADESLAYLQYRVVSKDGHELDLKEAKDMNAATAEKREQKAKKRGDSTTEESARNTRQQKATAAASQPVSPVSENPVVAAEEAPAVEAPMSKSKKRRVRRKKAAENAAAMALASAEAPASAMSARESSLPSASIVATDNVAPATIPVPAPDAVASEPAAEEVPTAEAPASEAPKKKRRSRSKSKPESDSAAVAAETAANADAEPAAAAESTVEAAPQPAASEEATAEEAPKKKRPRRRKKPAADAEAAGDAAAMPEENSAPVASSAEPTEE
ncbi:MAG: Rne/Rng family ribonuclease [Muribaculaceae bacterium]|nr:Rne/Rng family ribonuclease [Muribaculaceae bacterium]